MSRPFTQALLLAACSVLTCAGQTHAQDQTPARKRKGGSKKVELAHPFYWAVPDPVRGDYAADHPGYVAQVIRAEDHLLFEEDRLARAADVGKYEAHLFRQFDQRHDHPVAVLTGARDGDEIKFSGGGWTGTLSGGHFKASNGTDSVDLHHITRTPPTLGQAAPAGAIVLFDGSNLDAWAHRDARNWLKEDGPPTWDLIGHGAMEITPNTGYLLSHRQFGAYHLHVEFRTIGGPTNSGVYLQCRYEANINEVYGSLTANPNAQFDNCTNKSDNPGIRCDRPPLEWQTMDIDFHPARFDAAGDKTASARATEYFNGTLYYHDQPIGPPKLNAARYGEAPTGPIMLQEHGMPVEFRNIWLVELPN